MATEHTLPPDLGEVYNAVNNEVVQLHATWDIYRELFTEQDRIDLLNQFFSFAARTIQEALLDAVLLHITRLCDPAESRRGKILNKNLTLEQLIKELNPPSQLIGPLNDLLKEIKSASSSFIEHRHKRIAHTDLDHALADNANLPPFSRSSIEDTLSLIREFMNKINIHYRSAPTLYEETYVVGGGDGLVYALKMAERFQEVREKIMFTNLSFDDVLKEIRRPVE